MLTGIAISCFSLENSKALGLVKIAEVVLLSPIIVSEIWTTAEGYFVYNINIENGFNLKGVITHQTPTKSNSAYK